MRYKLTVCDESNEIHYEFEDFEKLLGFIKINEEYTTTNCGYVIGKE